MPIQIFMRKKRSHTVGGSIPIPNSNGILHGTKQDHLKIIGRGLLVSG